FLVDIEKQIDPKCKKRVFFDTIPLPWSYQSSDQPQAVDIPARIVFNVDVFSTAEGTGSQVPHFKWWPNCNANLFDEPAEFILTIEVTAENAGTQTVKLRLKWNGAWDNFEIEAVPETKW